MGRSAKRPPAEEESDDVYGQDLVKMSAKDQGPALEALHAALRDC